MYLNKLYEVYILVVDKLMNTFSLNQLISYSQEQEEISWGHILIITMLILSSISGFVQIIKSFSYPVLPTRGTFYQSILFSGTPFSNKVSKSWIVEFFAGLIFISPAIPFLFYITIPLGLFLIVLSIPYILNKDFFIFLFLIFLWTYFFKL